MKSNQRRPRSRGNGKRHFGRSNGFESAGPEGKIRGSAQQVFDKYQSLGRDALSSGDRVTAEGFFQHAEHYFRIISSDTRSKGNNPPPKEQDQSQSSSSVEVPITEKKDKPSSQKETERQVQA